MLLIVTLPFQIVMLLDAIGRALYRLFFSKKRLLEWVSSDEEHRNSEKKGAPLLQGMLTRLYSLSVIFGSGLNEWKYFCAIDWAYH